MLDSCFHNNNKLWCVTIAALHYPMSYWVWQESHKNNILVLGAFYWRWPPIFQNLFSHLVFCWWGTEMLKLSAAALLFPPFVPLIGNIFFICTEYMGYVYRCSTRKCFMWLLQARHSVLWFISANPQWEFISNLKLLVCVTEGSKHRK